MRLSVSAKLLGGMAVVIALTALLGAVAIYNLALLNRLTARMYDTELKTVQHVAAARAALASHRLSTIQLIDAPDPVERERQATRRREAEPAIRQALDALPPLLYLPEGRRLLAQIQPAWAEYKAASDQVVATAAAGDLAEAERLSQTIAREREQALSTLLDQLAALKDQLAADQAGDAAQTYAQTRNVTLALLVVILVVGSGFAWWLARAITREIRTGAQNLAAATAEILAAVTEQGASATQQAAAVSQTTATVDEVRVTAQQATQKAQLVAQMAQQTVEVATQGLETVETTVAGMQELRGRVQSIAEQMLALSGQTQQIGDIIATVDDLADQSNLLAVNAAIEAARAGDQGRGFAVVAQEVRSLAERSKAATVQVRTILTDIQRAANAAVLATEQGSKGAEEGARLVAQAGETIRHLATTIRESADSARQIVASAGQQGAGMDQIAAAMASINQATNETASGTRQLQKAAENINELAQRLTGLVEGYKLNGRA